MPPEEMQPPPPPPPPPQDMMEEEQEEQEQQEEEQEENEEQEEEEQVDQVPEEFVFDSEGVIMDDDLMKFQSQQKAAGRTGRARTQMIFSEEKGRYIKPMIPKGKVKKMAVDATLRAAAPYQKARRDRAAAKGEEVRNVYVESADFRAKKLARKAGSLVIFAVDASGSMAINRMSSAKGAVIKLLSETYTSRDKISLIPFYGNKAEVLLPPSKSVAMASNRLETLPCGGGSPLAHALETAMRTGLNAMSSGDTSRVLIVCVTDGRANVPLGVSNEDPEFVGEEPRKLTKDELNEEVLEMAKQVGALGMQLLVIDSENQFVSTGETRKNNKRLKN
uniref:VWFA domain-containing protein n=2 Tax=Lotharella globosa TaxID=91324 RepID=A0A7S3Z6K2_9EUKA